jgi:thiamine biosynthesis lipoprotein
LDGIGKVTDNITNSVSLKSLDEDIILDGKNICFKVKIDFSGIAKGYINDMAVSYLKNKNWHNFIVDSGGDLFAAGLNYDNEKWNVLIECSSNLSVELSDQSIATSGITYRKWDNKGKEYYHLINPKNPKIFSTNFQSVSVIKNTTEEADVWAKIIFLMGESAKQYVTNHNIKSIFVYKDGQTWP